MIAHLVYGAILGAFYRLTKWHAHVPKGRAAGLGGGLIDIVFEACRVERVGLRLLLPTRDCLRNG